MTEEPPADAEMAADHLLETVRALWTRVEAWEGAVRNVATTESPSHSVLKTSEIALSTMDDLRQITDKLVSRPISKIEDSGERTALSTSLTRMTLIFHELYVSLDQFGDSPLDAAPEISDLLRNLAQQIREIPQPIQRLNDFEVARRLENSARDLRRAYREIPLSKLRQKEIEIDNKLALIDSKKEQLDTAIQGHAKEDLTAHFAEFESRHSRSYVFFLIFTILVLLALVLFGAWTTKQISEGDELDWPGTAWRIAIVAGAAGMATYLGRQAAHHRTLLDWAGSIKVQLLTFEDYTASITEKGQKDAIRAEFARRVFGPEPTRYRTDQSDADQGVSTATILELLLRTTQRNAGNKAD